MKRDREPIARALSTTTSLAEDRIITVTGASDGLVVKRP